MFRKSLIIAACGAMLAPAAGAQIAIDGRPAALLSRLIGEGLPPPPLTLVHADPGQTGQVWRLATPAGDAWLLATAQEIAASEDGLVVSGLEAWQDGRPVLAAGGFRQLPGKPGAGELHFTALTLTGRHGQLATRLEAPTARVSWQAASPAELLLTGPSGLMAPVAGGRSLDWVAGEARFDGAAWHAQQFSAQLGGGLALVASSVTLRPDANGGLFIEAQGLLVSEALATRFRGLGGLRPPPVTLQAQLAPSFDRARRWTARLTAGPASLRLAGTLTREGQVQVTEIEEQGLLQALAEAGAADPLLTAGRLGLFYDAQGALQPVAAQRQTP